MLEITVSRNLPLTVRSSPNGKGQTQGSTVRVGSPSAATNQFTSLIRAEHESLSSARRDRYSGSGAAKAAATASLMTPLRSLLISKPIRFMWPIHEMGGFRYLI